MLRHAIEVGRLRVGQAILAPGCTRSIVGQHVGQVFIELCLLERFVQHTPRVSVADVVGVATHRADQHRQPRHQSFKQHGAGVFVVGRVNQQVGTQQETRDVTAPLEELHMLAQPQRGALQLKDFGVVLTNDK